MKKIVSDFFFYNRKQKIGVLVFSLITIINACIILFTPLPSLDKEDHTELMKELAEMKKQNVNSHPHYKEDDEEDSSDKILAPFDPNTCTVDELKKVGLSEKVSARIIKLRSKGWKFRTKESFRKIYGISEEQFTELEPYITISSEPSINDKTLKRYEKALVELNSADSILLCSLPGIGPGFAKRIISFRERLGGFLSKEQLLEVYGFDSVKFHLLRERILIDEKLVERVRVNSEEEKDLAKHPYIGYKTAKKITAYRKQHGNFRTISDLEKISTISISELEKIVPYITFEE
jgi:competence ComEA-like helix-hairpin-helix protein